MENKNYCVYMHISPSNKKYIGITCQRPKHRWNNGNGYKKQPYFYNAIKKYGWNNFKHIIIDKNLSQKDAYNKEIKLIEQYKTNNDKYGYNLSLGGDLGSKGIVMSQEQKRKIGDALRGEKNYMYGKHHTKEMKRKLSEAHKGKKYGPMSEERRKKISEALKGKILKEGTREKHRQNTKRLWQNKNFRNNQIQKHIGKTPWNKGLKTGPMSEEQKEKLRHNQNKPVICLETQIIYYSITEAKRKTNICHISQVCLGNRKTAGGYHWKYYKEQ